MDLSEMGEKDVDWISRVFVNTAMNLSDPQKEFPNQLSDCQFFKKGCAS